MPILSIVGVDEVTFMKGVLSHKFLVPFSPSPFVHPVGDDYPQEQPDCFSIHEPAQSSVPSVIAVDHATIAKKGRTFDEIREENRRKKLSKIRSQSPSSHQRKHKESKPMKGQQKCEDHKCSVLYYYYIHVGWLF